MINKKNIIKEAAIRIILGISIGIVIGAIIGTMIISISNFMYYRNKECVMNGSVEICLVDNR